MWLSVRGRAGANMPLARARVLVASQAVASLSINVELIPSVYRANTHGGAVCYGAPCFVESFLSIAALNVVGLVAAIWLARRNRDSLPVDRLAS